MNKKIFPIILVFFLSSSFIKESLITAKHINPSDIQIIPVIFHVVHGGQAVGTFPNISADTIKSNLTYINKVFVKCNMKIQFVMAVKNPNGEILKEPGIDRMCPSNFSNKLAKYPIIPSRYDIEKWVFNSMWNPKQYINVWYGKLQDSAGRGSSPYMPTNYKLKGMISIGHNPSLYSEGLVLAASKYCSGNTFTHEIGHYFGLGHVYDNGCSGSDYCDDTYQYDNTVKITNIIQLRIVTDCNGIKHEKNNFMDSNTVVKDANFKFTPQQIERMKFVLKYAYNRPRPNAK